MNIIQDDIIQKFINIVNMQDAVRVDCLRWMNNNIHRIQLKDDKIVEIKSVTYAECNFVIINVIKKTSFGYNDTIHRYNFESLGPISTEMYNTFTNYKSFEDIKNNVSDEIAKKYIGKTVSDGKVTSVIDTIFFEQLVPFMYLPRDVRINPINLREFYIV